MNTKHVLDSIAFNKQKYGELPTKDEIAAKDDVRAIIHKVVPGIVALEVKDIRAQLPRRRSPLSANSTR